MRATHSPARVQLIAGLVLSVVLVAGVVGGMALERWRNPPLIPPAGALGGFLAIGPTIPKELMRLHLTPEQTRQIKAILAGGGQRTTSIFKDIYPRLAAAAESTDAEVRLVLTPDQRSQLRARRQDLMVRVLKDSLGHRHIDTIPLPPAKSPR